MSQFSKVWKMIAYSFGTGVAASLAVLFIGMCVFGVQFSERGGQISRDSGHDLLELPEQSSACG